MPVAWSYDSFFQQKMLTITIQQVKLHLDQQIQSKTTNQVTKPEPIEPVSDLFANPFQRSRTHIPGQAGHEVPSISSSCPLILTMCFPLSTCIRAVFLTLTI